MTNRGTLPGMSAFDDDQEVTPDGTAIRRMRRRQGWSRRAFVRIVADVSFRESGLRETVSINLLEGMEEANEPVPYAVLCRVAAGLDADPVTLVSENPA